MKPSNGESVKSIRSGNIMKSTKVSDKELLVPELEVSLPEACRNYNVSYTVDVKKDYQQDDFIKKIRASEASGRYKKISIVPRVVSTILQATEQERKPALSATTTTTEVTFGEETLLVTAVYDNMQHLVEIILDKISNVPHSLIQIIKLLLPAYEYITRISFYKCVIDAYVVYELNKILSISSSSLSIITDLSFDETQFPAEYLLDILDNKCAGLKNLSLARCNINDETCKEIATRLHFTKHTEKTLIVLNLSSNHITDCGAKHLGEALRTNRHLRYLNLADNRIGDDGAAHIFNSLMEFLLTYEELNGKRRRRMEYLKAKRLVYLKIFSDVDARSFDEISQVSRKNATKKKKLSATSLRDKPKKDKDFPKDKGFLFTLGDSVKKAELIACDLMGPFVDPFQSSSVKRKDDHCFSLGNFVLCYLNLSYNRLTYLSVNKLVSVLEYQKANKTPNQHGLIKAVIEGNELPVACNQYLIINELFRQAKSVFAFGSGKATDSSARRKSRVQPVSSGRN